MAPYQPTKVNWQAYFKEFCKVHGGDPVLYEVQPESKQSGCLLFRDGWTYGRTVKGLELPPASKQQQKFLIKQYWTIRSEILTEEFRRRSEDIRELAKLQAARSAPLIVPGWPQIQDDGSKRFAETAIDFKALLYKVQEIREMLDECHEKLVEVADRGVTNENIPVFAFNQAAVLAELEEIETAKR